MRTTRRLSAIAVVFVIAALSGCTVCQHEPERANWIGLVPNSEVVPTDGGGMAIHIPSSDPEARVFVLVHGFPGSPLDFVDLASALASGGGDVWILCAPGHGGTDTPQSGWALEPEVEPRRHATIERKVPPDPRWRFELPQYVAWLGSFLGQRKLASREVVLITHSVGAEIAARTLAPDDPAVVPPRVSEIVFLNPWLPSLCEARSPWSFGEVMSFVLPADLVANQGPRHEDEVYERLFFDASSHRGTTYREHQRTQTVCPSCRTYYPEFVAVLQATNREQYGISVANRYTESRQAAVERWLGGPRDPGSPSAGRPRCLLIQSRYDRLFGAEYSAKVGESIVQRWGLEDRDAIVLSRTSHMVQVERPADVAKAIQAWLR